MTEDLYLLNIHDAYDYLEYSFQTEKELIDDLIYRKLAPNEFTISMKLDPVKNVEYKTFLNILVQELNKNMEVSRVRLRQLNKNKEDAQSLLGFSVHIFDSEIRKEVENIENNSKKLESCNI